jgi:hypothetical protein
MEFRDYAAKETTALVGRLLASQTETSVQQFHGLREALEAAVRGIEAAATPTSQADQELQELIRRLNTAAGAAARAASQKVQKEAQTQIDAANAELEVQRQENERLNGVIAEERAQTDQLRADLQKETERAETADRDLDAAIEAHSHVDAARLEAESQCRQLTAAKTALESA